MDVRVVIRVVIRDVSVLVVVAMLHQQLGGTRTSTSTKLIFEGGRRAGGA